MHVISLFSHFSLFNLAIYMNAQVLFFYAEIKKYAKKEIMFVAGDTNAILCDFSLGIRVLTTLVVC
jgi:hypothetical protein